MKKASLSRIVLGVAVVALAQAMGMARSPQASSQSGTPSSHPGLPIGAVTQIHPGGFRLHTDAGPDLQVQLPDGVSVLRVPPGAMNLRSATKIPASEISVGDRVLVRGHISEDQKSILATTVIVMTQADLTKAREAERLQWQQHGIGGIVKAVDDAGKQVTISVMNTPPTPENPTHPVTISLAPDAVLLRYAPDSVKFSDAKPGSFEEIKVGDQVRALGTKSEDGSHFTAEKLVSGTFRTIGATVISVDTSDGTLTVKDLTSGKALLVRTNADTRLHRLPPSLAQMIAAFNSPKPPSPETPARPTAGAPPGKPGPEAGGRPSAKSGNIQQMLEHSPTFTLNELKPQEPVVVVSTEGIKPSEVTAVTLLAGVEPILAARPKGSDQNVLGPWNMSMGEGGGGTP